MTEKTKRPALGQWCTLKGWALKRRTKRFDPRGKYDGHFTQWLRYSGSSNQGMFIGWRTMPQGETHLEWEFDDERSWQYPVFKQTSHVEVWLFVLGERRKIIQVFPQDVEMECE